MTYTPPVGAGNVTTASATTGGTATVNKPSNLADDDLIVWVVFNQTAGTVTTPTGFTHLYHATTSGTRTFYVFSRKISATAGSAAAEPSTYSATMSQNASRWITVMFRLPGVSGLDAAPASDVYNSTATTSLVDPAVTAVAGDALCLAINYTNNSSVVFQTFSLSGWTNLVNSTVTSGASTSVLDVEYLQLTASGSTGTKTFTMSPTAATSGGFLLTLTVTPVAASGTGSLSLTGTGTATAPNTGAGAASLDLTGSGTAAATASGSGSLSLTGTASAAGGTLGAWLARGTPRWAAHRDGFYATYGEFTVAGFNALAAWNPDVAWNIDVFKTSDGEWVASHDQTTGRVLSGTSLDIPTNTWASISAKTTLVGGNPVARIDDLVAVAPAGTIFFVDNKANNNTAAFFSKLTALGLSPSNVVNKNFIGSTAMLTAAQTNGYTTWAYGFDTDMAAFASNHSLAAWLGFDYAGTQGNWDTIIGYGQLSFAHILSSTANKATADSKAATAGGSNFGYMVATVSTVVPAVASGSGTLTLTGTGTARATAAGSGSISLLGSGAGAIPASGTGSISLTGTGAARGMTGGSGSISLSGTSTTTSPASGTGTLTLTGTGLATAPGGAGGTGSITLTGTGTARAVAASSGTLTLSAAGTATAPTTGAASLTLTGSAASGAPVAGAGAISLTGTGTARATAAGSGSLSLSGSGGARAVAVGTAVMTLTGTGAAAGPGTGSGAGSLTLTGGMTAKAAAIGSALLVLTGGGINGARDVRVLALLAGQLPRDILLAERIRIVATLGEHDG